MGAYVESEAAGLPSFNRQAGKPQSLFLKFVIVGDHEFAEGGQDSAENFCQTCYSLGALPYLTLQPDYATTRSLLTTRDVEWIERFTRDVGALKRPVFIRFAHEMNGDWYPWGWKNVSAGVYIDGYRKVADAFRRNAPKATLIWAPSQNWGPSVDPLYSNWYPGDEYVDWVGLTTYQWPFSGLGAHQFMYSVTLGQGPEGDFYSTFALGHGKPMMLTETASGDDSPGYYDNEWAAGEQDETGVYGTGVNQGAQNWWIRQVYGVGGEFGIDKLYPQIRAVCWFGKGDYYFGGSDTAAHSTGFDAYRSAIANPYWTPFVPTPPVTAIEGIGADWRTRDVMFSLTATATFFDDFTTYYRIGSGEAIAYRGPVTIGAEGTTTVAYHSVDASGNTEPEKTVTVRIDKTPPTTTDDHAASYIENAAITLTARDGHSGVASTEWTLDGVAGSGVATTSVRGAHTLVYRSTDNAGNAEASHTVTFKVTAPPPQRTAISAVRVSPSTPKRRQRVRFTASLAPSAAATVGATTVRLQHLETKTVTERVRGKKRRVKVSYWRARGTLPVLGHAGGVLTASTRLPYRGSWRVYVSYAGSESYRAATSAAKRFWVR
jgi:hypothetical protein